ncbi:MAG: hypothetical protein NTY02_01820 [Acidobacteria bacterium]|nr:hypothetical protein [Acidobacteriota bacterium]
MNDSHLCGNPDVLMSYLYEEGDPTERRAFEAHLDLCARCAADVRAFRSVRGDLAAWAPPETMLGFRIVRDRAPAPQRWAWLSVPALPAWAQLAAASLVIGVAVGVSGLDIRYDQQGLSVRTGWSKPAAVQAANAAPAAPGAASTAAAAPWRAELVALREELRSELRPAGSAPAPAGGQGQTVLMSAGTPLSDEAFMARVRQLIEASETRQQRELALRLTQVVRDVDTQRRSDMARVADGIGVLEGRTGAAVAQQREMMNYLMRVSQKQQ